MVQAGKRHNVKKDLGWDKREREMKRKRLQDNNKGSVRSDDKLRTFNCPKFIPLEIQE